MELPLLWVPGCVLFPGQYADVTLHGRGRARALGNAEEANGGRLVIAPGGFGPRRTEDLPPVLCSAQILPEIVEGGRRLEGVERVRVIRVARSGRSRMVEVEPIANDPHADKADIVSLQSAWRQLCRARDTLLPRSNEIVGYGSFRARAAIPWIVASLLPAPAEMRLAILAEEDVAARILRVTKLVQAEVDVALLERRIVGAGDPQAE